MPSAEERFGPVERIGLTDEWIEWFDRALAEILAEKPNPDPHASWRPIFLSVPGPPPVRTPSYTGADPEAVRLVRAAMRDYTISRHPWGFTA